jgi:DNA-binding NarL/FixJ family response regulator
MVNCNLTDAWAVSDARMRSRDDKNEAVQTGRRTLSAQSFEQLNNEMANWPGGIDLLTPTQLRVLRGVHSGLANKQIAFELGITEATVKAHMTALMRKLNVRNRTQVAILAEKMSDAFRPQAMLECEPLYN